MLQDWTGLVPALLSLYSPLFLYLCSRLSSPGPHCTLLDCIGCLGCTAPPPGPAVPQPL